MKNLTYGYVTMKCPDAEEKGKNTLALGETASHGVQKNTLWLASAMFNSRKQVQHLQSSKVTLNLAFAMQLHYQCWVKSHTATAWVSQKQDIKQKTPDQSAQERGLSEHNWPWSLHLHKVLGQENICEDSHNSGSLGVSRIDWARTWLSLLGWRVAECATPK